MAMVVSIYTMAINHTSNDRVTYAKLDVDDTSGYGPETITSFKQIDGIYRYYVYQYSQ